MAYCPDPIIAIETNALDKLLLTIETELPEVRNKSHSRTCFIQTSKKHRYVNIQITPEVSKYNVESWQTISCNTSTKGKKWKCQTVKNIYQITYQNSELYVFLGTDIHVGINILLKKIPCGVENCIYKAVDY